MASLHFITPTTVAGADPAVGAEASITVPSGEVWELLSFIVRLITGATAANRQAQLVIDDGTNILWQSDSPSNQIASQTRDYVAGSGLERQDEGVNAATKQWALPTGLVLVGGNRIRTVTAGIVVAEDNYGIPRAVLKKLG